MRLLGKKHWQFTRVATLLLFQMIDAEELLEHYISRVFFVADDITDTLNTPFSTENTGNSTTVQVSADNAEGISGNNTLEYFKHNRCGIHVDFYFFF